MASAMSVTWNSSKHSSQASSANCAAASRIGSSPACSPSFHLLAEAVDALVHVEHEFVEMRAPLARHRARLEEQVHQHGLAAADVAVDVEPLDRRQRAFAFGEQPAERRRFAGETVLRDSSFEPHQHIDHRHLCGIGLELARSNAGGVSRCYRARHFGQFFGISACEQICDRRRFPRQSRRLCGHQTVAVG